MKVGFVSFCQLIRKVLQPISTVPFHAICSSHSILRPDQPKNLNNQCSNFVRNVQEQQMVTFYWVVLLYSLMRENTSQSSCKWLNEGFVSFHTTFLLWTAHIYYMPRWLLMPHLQLFCIKDKGFWTGDIKDHTHWQFIGTLLRISMFYYRFNMVVSQESSNSYLHSTEHQHKSHWTTLVTGTISGGVQTSSAAKGTNREFCLFQVCRNHPLYEVTQRLHEFLFQL